MPLLSFYIVTILLHGNQKIFLQNDLKLIESACFQISTSSAPSILLHPVILDVHEFLIVFMFRIENTNFQMTRKNIQDLLTKPFVVPQSSRQKGEPSVVESSFFSRLFLFRLWNTGVAVENIATRSASSYP